MQWASIWRSCASAQTTGRSGACRVNLHRFKMRKSRSSVRSIRTASGALRTLSLQHPDLAVDEMEEGAKLRMLGFAIGGSVTEGTVLAQIRSRLGEGRATGNRSVSERRRSGWRRGPNQTLSQSKVPKARLVGRRNREPLRNYSGALSFDRRREPLDRFPNLQDIGHPRRLHHQR